MYNDILGYLSNAYDDLDFKAWKVVTALVLPNRKKSGPNKTEGHYLLSKEELFTIEKQEKSILEVLGITKKIWHPKEYEAMATVCIASIHSANLLPKKNNPILQTIANEIEPAHAALAGKDAPAAGPGFHLEKLVIDAKDGMLATGVTHKDIRSNQKSKNERPGVNSLASWIFWSPDQLETIRSKPARLMINGPYGTGKTLILMALALEARQAGKRVGFMSCTAEDSILDQAIETFCAENNITFLSNKMLRPDAEWEYDYSTLHESLDCLYID